MLLFSADVTIINSRRKLVPVLKSQLWDTSARKLFIYPVSTIAHISKNIFKVCLMYD